MKRVFDLVFSVMGLVLLSPLFLAIGWCIYREDGGPVFYRGERVGQDGRVFRIFKFRTMVVNADKIGGPSAPHNDPRITRSGRFLRKHKLDELPQLINVLLGEMSLVGPRPEVKCYTNMFTLEERAILTVRPGITDWASLWNPDQGSTLMGAEDPDKAYLKFIRPTKVRLQLRYVQNQSLASDLKIIFLTLLALARPRSQTILKLRHRLRAY